MNYEDDQTIFASICKKVGQQSNENNNDASVKVFETSSNFNNIRLSAALPGTPAAKSRFVPTEGIRLTGGLVLLNEIQYADDDPMVVRISTDEKYWAVGYKSGIIRIFTGLGQVPVEFGAADSLGSLTAESEEYPVTDVRFFRSYRFKGRRLVATYSSGFVRVWDLVVHSAMLTCKAEIRESEYFPDHRVAPKEQTYNQPLSVTISYDNLRVVTAGADCVCRVYDARTMKEINRCMASNNKDVMDGHKMRILAVSYHPLGAQEVDYEHIFISGGWDDTLMIWDDRFPNSLWQYYGPHICGSDAIDIDPVTNAILAGNWSRQKALFAVFRFNHTIISIASGAESKPSIPGLFDDPIFKIVQNTIASPSMTYVAQWLNSETILVGGSDMNSIILINKKKMDVVVSIHCPGAIYSVAIERPPELKKTKEKQPLHEKEKRKRNTYTIAVCSGKSVFVLQVDRKVASGPRY